MMERLPVIKNSSAIGIFRAELFDCRHNKVPGHPTAISDCADGSGSHYLDMCSGIPSL